MVDGSIVVMPFDFCTKSAHTAVGSAKTSSAEGEGAPVLIDLFRVQVRVYFTTTVISPPRLSLLDRSVLEIDLPHPDGLRQGEQVLW